jgi:hypothetical protein
VADKDFKVKSGLDLGTPLSLTKGGTGQTSANNALNALLPIQTSQSGKYLTSDGSNTSWGTITSSFVPMTASTLNTSTTLTSNNKYYVNTSATRTLTLPASPTLGDEIYIYDASGTAATYNITIARNSNLINGNDGNLILDVNGAAISLSYTGSTYGWKAG